MLQCSIPLFSLSDWIIISEPSRATTQIVVLTGAYSNYKRLTKSAKHLKVSSGFSKHTATGHIIQSVAESAGAFRVLLPPLL